MPKPIKQSPVDAFLELSDDEKERVWESFDRVIPESETRPLSPEEQREWKKLAARAKRKPGRPRIGSGAQRVQVTVERRLLARADAYAKSRGMSRAQLVSLGLRKLVG